MSLSDDDKNWIRQTVAEIVRPVEKPETLPRLTVQQFAAAVEHHIDVIHRKIRCGEIPDHMIFGLRPKRISPRALDLFGVTALQARERLEARNLLSAPALLKA